MAFSLLVLVWQGGTFAYMSVYQNTPIPNVPPPPQTTYLYDRHGGLLTALHAEVNRTEIPFKDMPLHLKQAVVAMEDKNFYREGGVSLGAILRAAWVNVTRWSLEQGGSTITQQYVKNAYTGNEKSFARKTREAILAQKLNRIYAKDELLAKYLNSVYFGRGAYGIQAAAQTYFGVDARDLTLNQAATLAGLIPSPSRFDPIDYPFQANLRRDLVLDRMVEEGYLPGVTAEAQKKLELETKPQPPLRSRAAYFVDYAKRYLEDRYGVRGTFGGGLRVTTTIDPAWQSAGEKAVRSNLDAKGDPSAALVAIDPATGDIRVMVGGRNFKRVKFNLASQGHRQTGSAFKVFTLAAALQKGISLNSVWSGPAGITIGDPRCRNEGGRAWNVGNYGDSGAGTMSLAAATHQSVNTIYAQVVVNVGPDRVARLARRMGIESPLQPVCSITLGSQAVTPLEMTAGFATLAARGVYRPPRPVQVVKTSSGETLFRRSTKGRRALDEKIADRVTYALQGVVESGTGTAAQLGRRPVAGKTGTAQNYQDAWFCGYVPQLAACVWVGYPRGQIPMLNVQGVPRVFGGSLPARIWHDFMASALRGEPVRQFVNPFPPAPAPVEEEVAPPPPPPPPAPTPTPPAPTPTLPPLPPVEPSPLPSPYISPGAPGPTPNFSSGSRASQGRGARRG